MSESSESNDASEAVDQTPMTVEERLAFLEEQNEGLKRVGKLLMGLCLLIGVLLVWTQAGLRKSIYSEAVILGNASTPRATLTSAPNGHLAFLFYDHLGILPPNPEFGAIPYLDGFAIYDREGRPRIVMGINDQNKTILDVFDETGKLAFGAIPRPVTTDADGKPTDSSKTPTSAATPDVNSAPIVAP